MSSKPYNRLASGTGAGPWGLVVTSLFGAAAFLALVSIQCAVSIPFIMRDPQGFLSDPGRSLMALLADGRFQGLALIASMPVATALLVLFAKLRKGYPLRDYLAFRKVTTGQLLGWLAISVVFMALSDGVTWLLGRSVVPPVMVDLYRTPGAAPFLHVAILLVAPVCEEISSRGFLFEGISYSRLGPVWAVVMCSFAWSMLHVQYDAYGIATVFAVGILLGIARLKTGSIYVPIAMHVLHNLAATIEIFWPLRVY